MKTLYDILGVSRTATQDDIKRAFHKLAHQHHPDKGGDAEVFKKVSEAYSTLSDPRKRSEYDYTLPSPNLRNANDPIQFTQTQQHQYQTVNVTFTTSSSPFHAHFMSEEEYQAAVRNAQQAQSKFWQAFNGPNNN